MLKLSLRVILMVGGAMAFLFIIGYALGKPAILGYSTYQQIEEANSTVLEYIDDVVKVRQDLVSAQANLSAYVFLAEKLQSSTQELNRHLIDCQVGEESAEQELKRQQEWGEEKMQLLQQERQQQETACTEASQEQAEALAQFGETHAVELAQREQLQQELQKSYDILAGDSARRICCKEKVDNPDINYYIIFNGKIVCSEEGNRKLDCFSSRARILEIGD